MLTTGVDAPTCKNVVIARVIGSMVEFKQIIGRGIRLREDCGKLSFTIIDYTGAATQLFADPAFDGDPVEVIVTTTDEEGNTTSEAVIGGDDQPEQPYQPGPDQPGVDRGTGEGRRKIYFDGGQVEIAAHLVYDLDAGGKQLRVVQLTQYAGERVRTLFAAAAALRRAWRDPDQRGLITSALEERGITIAALGAAAGQPDADPFDLLCHVAFNGPLLTRRQRAARLRRAQPDFFAQYGPDARAVLDALLDKYAAHGVAQFSLPDALKVPPLSDQGNVAEIAGFFGGGGALKAAVKQMQALLYAA